MAVRPRTKMTKSGMRTQAKGCAPNEKPVLLSLLSFVAITIAGMSLECVSKVLNQMILICADPTRSSDVSDKICMWSFLKWICM